MEFEQRVWFWDCAGDIQIKHQPHGIIEGRLITYKCSCGERKVIKTI